MMKNITLIYEKHKKYKNLVAQFKIQIAKMFLRN